MPEVPASFLLDLWRMVQAAGAFGGAIMFFLWKRAEDRADRLQNKINEVNDKHHAAKDLIIERQNKALNDNSLVLQGLKDLLQSKLLLLPNRSLLLGNRTQLQSSLG